jgi:hypothetical protein
MSIAAEAALLDVIAAGGRTAQQIQRSLASGRCAECDLPVSTGYKRRRPCLCPRCAQTLAWCSPCQRPKAHSAFARCASNPNGLNAECRACRLARKLAGRPHPQCSRKGCTRLAAKAGKGNYRKLCEACLETHAWCSDCERARLRREFAREVRLRKRHAGICHACDRARKPPTGIRAAEIAAAHARYAAIRDYAQANPTAGKAAIIAALGVTAHQIREAMVALGFRLGHGPKRAVALERYRAIIDLSPAEIMECQGLGYNAAIKLRSKARQALERTATE